MHLIYTPEPELYTQYFQMCFLWEMRVLVIKTWRSVIDDKSPLLQIMAWIQIRNVSLPEEMLSKMYDTICHKQAEWIAAVVIYRLKIGAIYSRTQ